MGFMEERIAKAIVEKVQKELGDKLHEEFGRMGEEMKKMVAYMNELDARIAKLEESCPKK